MNTCDVLIVGGGIAGLSLASALAGRTGVILAEAEPTLGYHTSSRSARFIIPSYGPPVIRELTVRTLVLIRALEAALPEPVLTPRSFLLVGTEEQVRDAASAHMHPVTTAEAHALAPQLRPETFTAAGLDAAAEACDTDLLLRLHRQMAAAGGARIIAGCRITAAVHDAGWWHATTGDGQEIRTKVLVNAAGAWADDFAARCGVQPRGLQPYRRSAAVVRAGNPPDPTGPMVAAADSSFYYRPEGNRVLISPSESEPSEAEDAQARPADIEALIRRINAATTLDISGVERSWTGLRTQAADGHPVVGPDGTASGFFWLAGQGGYGFQTSSAVAELAAEEILGHASISDRFPALAPVRPGV